MSFRNLSFCEFFFFFQAEDGIRAFHVTGVPTCALPICCRLLAGEVIHVEHARRTATVQPIIGPAREVGYDQIVLAPGSVSRTLPIPGLREQAIGFKSIGEAIYLRNKVLERLDVAATTTDAATRAAALTFVFIGGGYAGIEALAELEDMARDALRYYPELKADET